MSDCGDVKKVFVATKTATAPLEAPLFGITISDLAAQKIKQFITADNNSTDEYALHVAVVKDGCSGKSYVMKMAPLGEAASNGDKIFSKDGAHVVIEKTSYLFVTGSILDYTEALTGSGFVFNNPNVKKTCSCGSSFAV
jgi:iron-sulfur cluster assembly accessory protein